MRTRTIGLVAAAVAALLVLALLSVNFLVRHNRDYLIGRAEQVLGRKIAADGIEITLLPVGVRVKNLALADDPAFSTGNLLHADGLSVEFQVLPLLIGRLRPQRIVLVSPRLTIVRDPAGRYNFGPALRDKNTSNGTGAVEQRAAEGFDRRLPSMPALEVFAGTLHYRDLRGGGELVASHVELKTGGFAPDRPLHVELEAAVAADRPNFRFRSRIGPLAGIGDYREVPLDGEINADALDLGRVNKALPQINRALPRALRFDGVYTIRELRFRGTLNNLSLKGAVTGSDASFRFE